jgi:hypothetical protein
MNKMKATGGRYYYSEYGYGYGTSTPNGKAPSEAAETKAPTPAGVDKE